MTAFAAGRLGARGEARGVGVNLLSLAVQVTGPAYHALLARALGAGGYGLFTWSRAIIDSLAVVAIYGMDLAIRRFVGQALATGEKNDVHAAVGSALRVVVVAGILLFAGMFFAAPYLAAWQEKPGLVTPLRVLALGPLFFNLTTVLINATQAAHVMRYGFWTRGVAQPIMLFSFLAAALYVSPGTLAACAAVVGAYVVTVVVSAVFYHRMFSLGPTLAVALRGPIELGIFRYAGPLVLASVFWTALARLDLLFYGRYADATNVGVYAACLMFAGAVCQLKGAFDPVVCAMIPGAIARSDMGELRVGIQRQTRWVAIAVIPLFVLFFVFGDTVLQLLGSEFLRGAGALAILTTGEIISAFAIAAWIVPLSGYPAWSLFAAATGFVLKLGLLQLLVPRYGMQGAALSAAICLSFAQLALVLKAYRITGVQPFSLPLLAVIVAGAAATLAGWLVAHHWSASALVRFLGGGAVAAAAYVGVLVAFGLDREERALLSRGLVALRGSRD